MPFSAPEWQATSTYKILVNSAYLGQIPPLYRSGQRGRHGRRAEAREAEPVHDTHPALIDREQWEAVQAGLKARSRRGARDPRGTQGLHGPQEDALIGLAQCGVCGQPCWAMRVRSSSGRGSTLAYLRCRSSWRARVAGEAPGCGGGVRRETVYAAVRAAVEGVLLSAEGRAAYIQAASAVDPAQAAREARLREDRARASDALSRLWQAIESGLDGPDGRERIRARAAEIEAIDAELARHRPQPSAEEAEARVTAAAALLSQGWDALSRPDEARLYRALIGAVRLWPKGPGQPAPRVVVELRQ